MRLSCRLVVLFALNTSLAYADAPPIHVELTGDAASLQRQEDGVWKDVDIADPISPEGRFRIITYDDHHTSSPF